jgi:hypothetical protein
LPEVLEGNKPNNPNPMKSSSKIYLGGKLVNNQQAKLLFPDEQPHQIVASFIQEALLKIRLQNMSVETDPEEYINLLILFSMAWNAPAMAMGLNYRDLTKRFLFNKSLDLLSRLKVKSFMRYRIDMYDLAKFYITDLDFEMIDGEVNCQVHCDLYAVLPEDYPLLGTRFLGRLIAQSEEMRSILEEEIRMSNS